MNTELKESSSIPFLSVLFPFLQPLLEKMNYSFFPPEVLEFFYNFLRSIKSDRSTKEDSVMFAYIVSFIMLLLLLLLFSLILSTTSP